MFTLEFNNLNNLNVSLQVGDAVYAHHTMTQLGSSDPQAGFASSIPSFDYGQVGANYFIGILREIENPANNEYILSIDDDPTNFPFSLANPYTGTYYVPSENDFIMFSKYDQSDGDVLGYYADVKLVNDSKEKAELYVISSEVIINSK